eukprot:TRINITY_DN7454_c0_g1_i11.p1 TRINITY_DN7454_c0_g1~~TRINITY_DN7454_c0_g1_i11.p1  ORF type:complete len:505 (+),score=92.06 TRINITY_DN7454_c0_g1_i11:333-1847(+)
MKEVGLRQEDVLKAAFEHFDKFGLGYLPQESHPKLFSYLIVEKQFDEAAIEKLLAVSIGNSRLTLKELIEAWRKHPADESSETSTEKLINLLNRLKHKISSKKHLQAQIDWAIEKIMAGKVYEPEVEVNPLSASGKSIDKAMNSITNNLMKLLPWMRYYTRRQTHLKPSFPPNLAQSEQLANSVNSPNFNTFELIPVLGRNNVLPLTAHCIFSENKLFSLVDEKTFGSFVVTVRDGYYQENPYHNDLHAADVLQMCHYFLNNGLREVAQLDDVDCLGFLVAALVHDLKHPGITNGLLETAKSELAVAYNGQAVLENYHLAQAFSVVQKCCLFQRLTFEQASVVRKRIIGCVLATDMSKHFGAIQGLQSLIAANDIEKGKNADRIINKKSNATEFESKQFIMNICLHAADIGSSGRVFTACEQWARRITAEFWRQGDLELKLRLPISPLCDRRLSGLPESQVEFINTFSGPLFRCIAQVLPKCESLVRTALESEQRWRTMIHTSP